MKTIRWIIALVLLAILNYFLVLKDFFPTSTSESTKDTTKIEIRKSFYDDGKLKTDAQFVDNKMHGLAHNYYKSGLVHTEMHYVFGVKNGLSTWFYPDGKIYRITPYAGGKISGIQKKYYKNKKLKAEIPYLHGKLLPGTKEYTEFGKLISVYPKIQIKKLDQSHDNGRILLKVRLSEKVKNLDMKIFLVNGDKHQKVSITIDEDGFYNIAFPSVETKKKRHNVLIKAAYKSDRGNKVLIEKSYSV